MMSPEEALGRVLGMSGIGLPRGVLGDEVAMLADALEGGGAAELGGLVDRAARAHWPALQGPLVAAVARGAQQATGDDREAFALVSTWADDPDPDNPFARALVVRAAVEVRAARARARELLRHAEEGLSEDDVRAAALASVIAGAIAVALLDLDPDDFAPELATYVEADGAEGALDQLARETGDEEIRTWARRAVAAVSDPQAPIASAAVGQLAAGPPPPDPAHDLVWVPTILALAEEGVERALVAEAGEAPPSPRGGVID